MLGGDGPLPGGVPWAVCGADVIIAVASFAMLPAIGTWARRQADRQARVGAALFGACALSLGVLHVWLAATVGQPASAFEVLAKVLVAALSSMAAIALRRRIAAASGRPTIASLQQAVQSLEREIERRRWAEAHAGDVEENLAATLASIEAGMIATDATGNVTRLNSIAERITGWTHDQALGRSYWEVFVQDHRLPLPSGQSLIGMILARGITVEDSFAVDAISRQGVRTPVEVRCHLKADPDGEVRGAVAIVRDMTRLNLAEEDRRRLAAIVESSNDAIIGKTLDGRITNWNRAATEMFGYTEAEALGHSVQMLIPPDRRQEEMDILANIFDGRVVPPFETVRLGKNGRPIDLSITISPIRDGTGRIVGGSKIARDIGPQRAAMAALRESEARLRFALEVAEIGNWELDLRSGAMHRSDRHDRCFGYTSLQPEWSIPTFLRHVHPEDRDAAALAYRRSLLRIEDWRSECRVVWPDGSIHWIRIQGSTRYDTGDANRMLGIVADVTQHKLAEETRRLALQLENDNRQIQESNRLKSQFLANMSHELRSPLNAIIGFSDLLHADSMPANPAQQHQFIGHIRTSGRHLLQLINDVLDLSKVESGKFEFFPEPVGLTPLIKEVRDVLYTLSRRKRLSVEVETDPTIESVVIDPARMKQALYNYLSNAIKFTPEGGTIRIRAYPCAHARFRVDVEDTGPGIAEADLPRLFVEFQQLDDSFTKRHQGTGLGLALTRRLVQAQGGSVGVQSVVGRGSVFHLELPVSPHAGAPEGNSVASTANGHVLVIGDHAGTRSRIADALSTSGHRVDVAAEAAQAPRHAGSTHYDALALDLMVSSRRGLSELARIRRDHSAANAPVLAITVADEDSAAAGFAVEDVLTKPLDPAAVIQAMTRAGLARRAGTRVAVIDDDRAARELMIAALADLRIEGVGFDGGETALREMPAYALDAIVLDLIMPAMDGFQVMDRLREDARWHDTPVFVWTSMELTDSEYDLLAISARAIVGKGGARLEPLLERLRRWRAVRPSLL